MNTLKTLKDMKDWILYHPDFNQGGVLKSADTNKIVRLLNEEHLKQEAIKELKKIDDLSFRAPECLTKANLMLIKAEEYIKWKNNITEDGGKMKLNSKTKRTEKEWRNVFLNWSKRMDKYYGKSTNDRNDACMWNHQNPAEWMEPFNEYIFDAWIEYDAPSPGGISWANILKTVIC